MEIEDGAAAAEMMGHKVQSASYIGPDQHIKDEQTAVKCRVYHTPIHIQTSFWYCWTRFTLYCINDYCVSSDTLFWNIMVFRHTVL